MGVRPSAFRCGSHRCRLRCCRGCLACALVGRRPSRTMRSTTRARRSPSRPRWTCRRTRGRWGLHRAYCWRMVGGSHRRHLASAPMDNLCCVETATIAQACLASSPGPVRRLPNVPRWQARRTVPTSGVYPPGVSAANGCGGELCGSIGYHTCSTTVP
jgi:hypothetical protein